LVPHALDRDARGLRPGLGQEEDEPAPIDARRDVVETRGGERAGDPPELVRLDVVVEIEQGEAERSTEPERAARLDGDGLVECSAVVEAGLRVAEGVELGAEVRRAQRGEGPGEREVEAEMDEERPVQEERGRIRE